MLKTFSSNGVFQNLSFDGGFGSIAPAYGCRAWINFNGTGTPAIRGSANVSSITDVNVGRYELNLVTAMPDTNYSVAGTCDGFGVANSGAVVSSVDRGNTTTKVALFIQDNAGNAQDFSTIMASVFR
jgi:hypothetical protein